MECVRLRVKDLDFAYHQITVREGKKDAMRRAEIPKRGSCHTLRNAWTSCYTSLISVDFKRCASRGCLEVRRMQHATTLSVSLRQMQVKRGASSLACVLSALALAGPLSSKLRTAGCCDGLYALCITACEVAGLLPPCCCPRATGGFPTWRAGHHEHTRSRSATETVTPVALGTGQRRHQLRVTTRDQPPGPLCIGRQPSHQTLLKA
jgi:hypothetical protein